MSKLVRDKIPEIVMENGGTVHVHKVKGDSEYFAFLLKKLDEEVDEFKDKLYGYNPVNNHDRDTVEELVDIMTVVYSLASVLGYPAAEFERIYADKMVKNGGFVKRYVLEDE